MKPKQIKNAPTKIWLNFGDDYPDSDDFNELNIGGAVTWCEDKVYDNDIYYIRAGKNIRSALEELEAEHKALKEVAGFVVEWYYNNSKHTEAHICLMVGMDKLKSLIEGKQ